MIKDNLSIHFICLFNISYSQYSSVDLRDLSEISRAGWGVETEGGSQLFETKKREGL